MVFNSWKLPIDEFLKLFFFIGKYYWFVPFIIGSYIVFYLVQKKNRNGRIQIIIYVLASVSVVFTPENIKAEQGFCFLEGLIVSRFREKVEVQKNKLHCLP